MFTRIFNCYTRTSIRNAVCAFVYLQGMNFIVSLLLRHMDGDAAWTTLAALVLSPKYDLGACVCRE